MISLHLCRGIRPWSNERDIAHITGERKEAIVLEQYNTFNSRGAGQNLVCRCVNIVGTKRSVWHRVRRIEIAMSVTCQCSLTITKERGEKSKEREE